MNTLTFRNVKSRRGPASVRRRQSFCFSVIFQVLRQTLEAPLCRCFLFKKCTAFDGGLVCLKIYEDAVQLQDVKSVGGGFGLPSLYTHRVVTSSVSSSSQGSFRMHQVSSIMDSHQDWASVRPDRRGVYLNRKRGFRGSEGSVQADADV